MKRFILFLSVVGLAVNALADSGLTFDASRGEARTLTMPQGDVVEYTAYTRLYYVTNVEDSTYQYMNVFVPKGANRYSPILLRNYVGGYMASEAAAAPQAGDATGRALMEGYVVAVPGARGRNSVVTVTKETLKYWRQQTGRKKLRVGDTVYTGRAPKALLDLKAAVRYLREFDKVMPGDAEKIISDGTSAGGAMSSLLGATGNHPDYEPLLEAMGAARQRDDVFAAVCFCPIIDLDHADMAYEWLYNQTDSRQQGSEDVLAVSNDLKAAYADYFNTLQLRDQQGKLITADNLLDYLKREIIRAAQLAKNAGATIADTLGFKFSSEGGFGAPPINGGVKPKLNGGGRMPGGQKPPFGGGRQTKQGDYILDLDMATYLNYVVSTQPLKTAPAFDTQGVCGQNPSGENEEFGDMLGSSVNFTSYSAAKSGASQQADAKAVRMLNPMNYVASPEADVAPNWYIRHGARDRDTSFPVPFSLATKLQNEGKNVDFLLAWNRPHSGDYALDELFAWIKQVTR